MDSLREFVGTSLRNRHIMARRRGVPRGLRAARRVDLVPPALPRPVRRGPVAAGDRAERVAAARAAGPGRLARGAGDRRRAGAGQPRLGRSGRGPLVRHVRPAALAGRRVCSWPSGSAAGRSAPAPSGRSPGSGTPGPRSPSAGSPFRWTSGWSPPRPPFRRTVSSPSGSTPWRSAARRWRPRRRPWWLPDAGARRRRHLVPRRRGARRLGRRRRRPVGMAAAIVGAILLSRTTAGRGSSSPRHLRKSRRFRSCGGAASASWPDRARQGRRSRRRRPSWSRRRASLPRP